MLINALQFAFRADTPSETSKLCLLAMVYLGRRDGERVLFDQPVSALMDLMRLPPDRVISAIAELDRIDLVRDTGLRQGRSKQWVYEIRIPQGAQ